MQKKNGNFKEIPMELSDMPVLHTSNKSMQRNIQNQSATRSPHTVYGQCILFVKMLWDINMICYHHDW